MKTNDCHQARLMLPMETHAWPQVAHPMSPSMCRRRRGVLARKREGVSGAEQMRALLLMPLLARSAGKPTRKLTMQVSPRGGQIGIAVQQGGLLKCELDRCMRRALSRG